MEASHQADRFANLRAHKALPRRRVASERHDEFENAAKSQNPERRTDPSPFAVAAKTNEISQWLQRSSELLANPSYQLPLTPPQLPQDEDSRGSSKDQSSTVGDSSIVESTVVPETRGTPVNGRSPLTPDMTPPRHEHSLPLQVPSPLPPERSSRTNSFVTALEQASVDNVHSAVEKKEHSAAERQEQRETEGSLGHGLGLDIDTGELTPNANPRVVRESPFVQESLDSTRNLVDEDGLFVPEPAAVQEINIAKRPKRHFTDQPSGFWDGSPSPLAFPESFEQSPFVQEESEATREASNIAAQYLFQQSRRSPNNHEDADAEMGLLPVDSKRLSQMSATSTVIEALVMDATPTKRHKLRHTSKVSSLRAASSPLSGSNRSSAHSRLSGLSGEAKQQPKLHHVNGRIASWSSNKYRMSMNSDSGISMGGDGLRKSMDNSNNIPLSEVPLRRSSLRASKRLPRLVKPSARHVEHARPSTAPDRALGPKHMERFRARRALSESLALLDLAEVRPSRPLHQPEPVSQPAFRSSLSASPSHDASRTDSLTAASLTKHNAQQNAATALQSSPPADRTLQLPETPSKDEGSPGLRPPSMLTRTPFSAASFLSSGTPGPFELNEATAVSIYPHTNRSLLVVQQRPQPNAFGAPVIAARVAPAVTFSPHGAAEPAHAPLENPREAPRAPAVLLIPPTPASQASAATPQPAPQAAVARTSSRKDRSFAALRRTLSARRDSETRGPEVAHKRTRSFSARRPATADNGRETRLGPFWKPRGFWDDVEGGSDQDGSAPEWKARDGVYVRNTLGLPQLPSILGPIALARRLGSLKRKKAREGDAVERIEPPRVGARRYWRSASEGPTRRSAYKVSKEDLRVHDPVWSRARIFDPRGLNPVTSLQGHIERAREKRVENRQERQRERLKRNIGPAVLQADNNRIF